MNNNNEEIRLDELVKNDAISLGDMYSIVLDENLGNLDEILQAIEEISSTWLFNIWLGNSMETPCPINTKEDLKEALTC